MSKEKKDRNIGFGHGYVVNDDLPGFLIGRLFTLVEALGLKETQEKSFKDLVQNEIWNLFGPDGWRTKRIPGSLHNEIRYSLDDIKDEQEKSISTKGKIPLYSLDSYVFTVSYKKKE